MAKEAGRKPYPMWAVVALVVAVPLAAGNLTPFGIGRYSLLYDGVALPRLAAMLILATAAWALWWWTSGPDRPLAVDVVWGLLAALGAWAVVSAAASPHRLFSLLGQSERLEGVVTLVFYGLLYGLALQVVRSRRALRNVASGFVVASTILAVHGIVQYLGLERGDYTVENFGFSAHVAFATLGNANFLAALLALALPCAVGLALSSESRGRIGWGACAALMVVALAGTLTRGAWFAAGLEAAVAAAVVVVAWRKGRLTAERRTIVAASAALAVIALVAVAAILLRPEVVVGKLQSASGALSRASLAGIALSATSAHPLTGYGPDTFLAAFRAQHVAGTAAIADSATVNNAHSWPLQFAATLGVPGALLLVAAIGLALWRSRRILGAELATAEPLAASIWVACLGFSVAMLFNVAMIAYTVPFWLLLGALGASRTRAVPVAVPAARSVAVLSTLLTATAVLLSVTLVSADATYLRSRLVFNGLVPGDALSQAAEASRRVPVSIKYARGAGQVEAAAMRQAIAARASQTEVRTRFAAASGWFDRALAIDGQDYTTLAWLSALQAQAGLYLKDAPLREQAQATARAASNLDREHANVAALADGDLSAPAQLKALVVPPLP